MRSVAHRANELEQPTPFHLFAKASNRMEGSGRWGGRGDDEFSLIPNTSEWLMLARQDYEDRDCASFGLALNRSYLVNVRSLIK